MCCHLSVQCVAAPKERLCDRRCRDDCSRWRRNVTYLRHGAAAVCHSKSMGEEMCLGRRVGGVEVCRCVVREAHSAGPSGLSVLAVFVSVFRVCVCVCVRLNRLSWIRSLRRAFGTQQSCPIPSLQRLINPTAAQQPRQQPRRRRLLRQLPPTCCPRRCLSELDQRRVLGLGQLLPHGLARLLTPPFLQPRPFPWLTASRRPSRLVTTGGVTCHPPMHTRLSRRQHCPCQLFGG